MLFAITFLTLLCVTKENEVSQHAFGDHNRILNRNNLHNNQDKCKNITNCTCSNQGNLFAIECSGLNDIDHFLQLLKIRFVNSKIRHIYITKSTISHLPASAFQNLSITKISIEKSKVNNVSDDAFLGIFGLENLTLKDVTLKAIPKSVGTLNDTLNSIYMENDNLTSIDTTLQECSKQQMLSFKRNKISHIDSSAFLRMNRLLNLNLANNSIVWIDPRTFTPFGKLNVLDVTGNRLRSTDGFFRSSQMSIQTLKLGGNNISDVSNVTLHPLRLIEMLDLNDNPIVAIKKNDFENMTNTKTLIFRHCLLKSIHPESLQPVRDLNFLDISYNQLSYLDNKTFLNGQNIHYFYISGNRLESLTGIFQHTVNIRKIVADNNMIKDVDPQCFSSLRHLRELHLSRNSLTRVRNDTFVNNEDLKLLNISHNIIKYLERESFHGLYQLETLSLSFNMLTTLNNSIKNLPVLRTLKLSNNYLVVLDATSFYNMQGLQFLDLSNNLLESVEGAFSSMPNLQDLFLRNNSLRVITEQSFEFTGKLKNISISSNPLECNCLLKWLIELVADNKTVIIDDAQCKTPEWLKDKNLKDLSTEDVTDWPEDCPQECNCLCLANYTDYYIGVYCGGVQLTTVPAVLPNKTGYLDLSNNQIISVPQSILDNLTQLEYFFLDRNNVTSLPDLSSFNLRALTIDTNCLKRFPVSNVDLSYLEKITLSKNPWLCDCQTLDFRKWLLANEMLVSDVNSTRCGDTKENGRLRNRTIISLTEFLLCLYLIAIYGSICIGVLGFLLLVAGGKITYNRYRMNIKVWMYTRGVCSCLSCVKEEDLDEGREFDAFVSYSTEDEKFVVRELVPLLESGDKPFLLCLHYRQFPPGSFIQDSIMQAVKVSKRTILILSKNFLQSEWCRLEFKSAHHQVLEERLNRLIIIILGDLPPEEEIDPEIVVYLKSTTYLKWGENNFWNRLKYVMPRTPCEVTDGEKMRLLEFSE